MHARVPGLAPTLERATGSVRVRFGQDGPHTRLASLYQQAPCRMLFPTPADNDPLQGVLLTTTGGLTGGDRLDIEIDASDGAVATISTQAAEKIYRSTGPDCAIRVSLKAAPGAWLEWLMQETILFNGAKLARRTEADVASGGRLLAVESFVFGRAAMGEDFTTGHLHDLWRIRRSGKLIWMDALKLVGETARSQRFGLGGAAGCATLLYVGEDAAAHLPAARTAIAETDATGGATSFDGLLLIRLLAGQADTLRAGVMHLTSTLRAAIGGFPAQMPRVWSC